MAPTPSGLLHVGHARTFFWAWKRARERAGTLILRIEDIDQERSRPDFEQAALEDLAWLGLDWEEGVDCGGALGPYRQSDRADRHEAVWRRLIEGGWIYPSTHSRREISERNPGREKDGGSLFPVELRKIPSEDERRSPDPKTNWRFRVPDGERIEFIDERKGRQQWVAGVDFGDFLVWRKVGGPSYELAVVADDVDMQITEVVRGEDLLLSTARQILVYRALGHEPPAFRHESLVCDSEGNRLSKTAGSVSIRSLRERGWTASQVLKWRDS